MRTSTLLALACAVATAGACGKVSVDVASSDRKTNENLQRAQTTGKIIYNGMKAVDAWNDALDKISHDDEIAIGQMTAISVISEVGDLVLEDEDLLRYLNSVGNHVALQGDRHVKSPRVKGRRFWFAAIQHPDMNAFATPGGNVLITTGLLQRLNSEAELAFVFAHEIAHVDHEHPLIALKGALAGNDTMKSLLESRLKKDKNKAPITNLFDDLKIFENASDLASSSLVGNLNLFSPSQEREADATGLEYLSKAGYDPAAAQRVLDVLREASGERWSLSHGSPATRAEKLAKAAEKLPTGGKSGFARWQERGLRRLEAAVASMEARASAPAPAATPAP